MSVHRLQIGSGTLVCVDVDDPLEDARDLRLEIDGRSFDRRIHWDDDQDWQDMRVAAGFWDHADRVEAISADSALVDRCLAVERLFPAASDLLPA